MLSVFTGNVFKTGCVFETDADVLFILFLHTYLRPICSHLAWTVTGIHLLLTVWKCRSKCYIAWICIIVSGKSLTWFFCL